MLQMEKRAAQAGAAGGPSRVRLVCASPQHRALTLAESHAALEPAAISFRPLAHSQGFIKHA